MRTLPIIFGVIALLSMVFMVMLKEAWPLIPLVLSVIGAVNSKKKTL